MKKHPLSIHRFVLVLMCVCLVQGGVGPIDFTPDAQAATSAQKRKLRKFKRKARRFKKQTRILRRRLAVALLPDPAPPFIEMVTVGNPGNGNDPEDGDINNLDGKNNFGAVAETFQIGKYEVTNAQYAAFLNAVAAEDPNGLFDPYMESSRLGVCRS